MISKMASDIEKIMIQDLSDICLPIIMVFRYLHGLYGLYGLHLW